MATPRRLRMSQLLQTRDGTPANKDARLTNCILEKNGNELDVLKRPGFALSSTPATGVGAGATVIKDANGQQQIISVVNTTLYTTQSTVATTWTATGGSTDFGSNNNKPTAILFFNNLFWILAPVSVANAAGSGSVYSSPDGITWTLVTASPAYNVGFNRYNFGAVVFAGKMWVIGGNLNGTQKNDVWYSGDGVTWTRATASAAWSARLCPNVLVYNNKMWVIGDDTGVNHDVYSSSDGITWTQATAAAAWGVRIDYRTFVLAGKMWLVGGYAGATYYNECWYSTDGATWTNAGSAAWAGRAEFGCFVLNNLAYVATGQTASSVYSTDMWKSADGVTWTQVTTDIGISGTGASNPVTIATMGNFISANGTTYVFGQLIAGTWSSTIYKATTSTTTTTTGQVSAGVTPPVTAPSAVAVPGAIVDWSATLDGTVIAIKNTANAWAYTVAGQTLAQVTNANYPAVTVRGLVYLDGTFYVMDPYGQIWGSNVNDFTTWTALNLISAQAEPDGGVALTKYGQYVVAFGQYTMEFFFDAGNSTGSPLSSVQNATQMIGCASADSVTQAESSVFWIAQSKAHGQMFNPQRFVARLDGMSAISVSNPNIDRILNADSLLGAWGVYCKMLGHPFYVINLPQSAISLAFDMQTNIWYIFTTGTDQSTQSIGTGKMTYTLQVDGNALVNVNLTAHGFSDGDPVTIAGATQTAYNGQWNIRYVDADNFTFNPTSVPAATPATGSPTAAGITQGCFPLLQAFNYQGLQLFQHYIDGKIYQITDTTYSDNGVNIDTKGRFERFDEGLSQDGNSQNKFAGWIDIVTDRASTSMLMRWSDDDYQTYCHYRKVSLSPNRSRLHRCGTFMRRAFEIRHTDKAAMRFQGIDLGLEQGTE